MLCFLCLDSVVELLKDEFVQEKIDEVARLFYSNDSVTINLYAAAAAGLLALLRKKYFFYLFMAPTGVQGVVCTSLSVCLLV